MACGVFSRAMGATQDKSLLDRTFDFAMNKARDQDVIYFFYGIAPNKKFRRELGRLFEENFDRVRCLASPFLHIVLFSEQWKLTHGVAWYQIDKRLEGNFMMRYLVTAVYSGMSTIQDAQHIEEFFKVRYFTVVPPSFPSCP